MNEDLWFLNTLVSVRVPHAHGKDGISVLESRAPRGDSPPLHIHGEDEIFHVLEGQLLIRVETRITSSTWAGPSWRQRESRTHTASNPSRRAGWS